MSNHDNLSSDQEPYSNFRLSEVHQGWRLGKRQEASQSGFEVLGEFIFVPY